VDEALRVRGLTKTYGQRRAADGVSFHADAGRITAVLGRNGAGKTTTLECCTGLRTPDAGEIVVLGRPRTRANDPWLREHVGVMVQQGGLPMAPRARQVLQHVASLHRHPADLDSLVGALSLADVMDTPVRHLSGGQRQRLAVACALVGRPRLAFLDEPSSGVDPHARRDAWELLRTHRDGGAAVVLTTHHIAEAEELADHVVILDGGHVVAAGSVPELAHGHTLTLAALADPARAAGVVARFAPCQVSADGVVTALLPHADVATTHELAGALAAAGESGARFTLARRTLESVYLDLTRDTE